MRPDAPLKRARYGMRSCGVCFRGQRGSHVRQHMTQGHVRALLALIGLVITSSAIGADDMCRPLKAFLASIGPDQTQEVIFRTIWGGNFNDDPEEALFAKRCEHGGYGPGKAVCDYLMNFGAVEFSGNNAKSVITCISPSTRFAAATSLHAIAFTTHFGTENRGVNVNVDFHADEELGGMVRIVSADGY